MVIFNLFINLLIEIEMLFMFFFILFLVKMIVFYWLLISELFGI